MILQNCFQYPYNSLSLILVLSIVRETMTKPTSQNYHRTLYYKMANKPNRARLIKELNDQGHSE